MHKFLAALSALLIALMHAPLATALPDPPVSPWPGCDMAQLTKAINDRPKDSNAWFSRADCLLTPRPGNQRPLIKNFEAAIKDLERGLQLDPRNWRAHHNFGHAAELLPYENLAIYEFSQAIAINPKGAESYLGRGWAQFESCLLKQAAADFQRAASLDASMRSRIPTNERMNVKQAECVRPPPVPEYMRVGPQADPYFDHNSDYWRQRRWEERPH
jgi:hypothetical protein